MNEQQVLYASILKDILDGVVAQMVERSLSMRQARGSMPRYSKFFFNFDQLKSL